MTKAIHYFPKQVTENQTKDTGMAMVLICLLVGYFFKISFLLPFSIILLIVTMTIPGLFKPLALVWFGFSHILGTVMSKVILTLIFFGLVTPVGLIRQWTGADPMQMKEWKKGKASVFKNRNHTYTSEEIEKPY